MFKQNIIMFKQRFKLMLTVLGVLSLIFTSCGSDDDSPGVISMAKSVRLAENATLGSILTDVDGRTLYFFSNDTKDTSMCSGECVDVWPIFYTSELTLEDGLSSSDFKTITRTDGEKQTTYKGWPLYYFTSDNSPGEIKGENVGNIWFVAKPDYNLMYANAQLVGHDNKNYNENYQEAEALTQYIVDINGRTLYTFINDKNGVNNFTNEDFSNNPVWPIVQMAIDKIPSVLNRNDFSTINVHGRTQLTYKGWPLYYFGGTDSVEGDLQRGANRGVSFPSPGVWPIANMNTVMAPSN